MMMLMMITMMCYVSIFVVFSHTDYFNKSRQKGLFKYLMTAADDV